MNYRFTSDAIFHNAFLALYLAYVNRFFSNDFIADFSPEDRRNAELCNVSFDISICGSEALLPQSCLFFPSASIIDRL
jgi:hypothetical protein